MAGRRTAVGVAGLVLVTVSAVIVGQRMTSPSPSASPPPDVAVHTEARPQLVDPSSADAAATLATLRQVDDHPLFTMTYRGPSPKVDEVRAAPASLGRSPFACTVFFAGGGDPVFGRNFDWDHNPALVLVAEPTDAYRSISVVDISYLGYTSADAVHASRSELLRAVTLPFDGMNEHGLTIGMASVDDLRTEVRPGRQAIGSVSVMRQVLDRARTVDEAIEIFGSYNLDFSGGPGLHYIVADPSGSSAVVEFTGGVMRVVPGSDRWQVMENFYLSDVPDPYSFKRYRTAASRLASSGGVMSAEESMALLDEVAQRHTQWSAVYDLTSLSLRLTTGQRYDTVHTFSLN